MTRGVRIETLGHDAAAHDATLRDLTLALRASDLSIASDMRSDWINTVLRNHIAIVQGALQFLGLLVGAVGAFTLAVAISTSVVERAREFGVMQTLGATPARIVAVVVAEGLFVGLLSWLVAVAGAALLSYVLGAVVGVFLFDAALPLAISPAALASWLAIALAACALSAVPPAVSAAGMTIRETLAYV